MADERYAGLSDKRAILQVLGCLILKPELSDDPDLPLDSDDFSTETFYKIIFVAIFNLFQKGVTSISECEIDSYLSSFPEQYKVFQANKGLDWIADAMGMAQLENYEYWYHRVRKFSLLRYYEKNGLDTRILFDGNKVDATEENIKFDNMTEQDMIEYIETLFVIDTNIKYCANDAIEACTAGKGLRDLIHELMKEPDVGLPFASPILTTLTRGARMGCLYMRGSIQGGGKTRIAAMDACKMAIPYYWDLDNKEWVYTGISEPTVYIVTEQRIEELQTILAATISGINEEHIKYGMYDKGELERVEQATQYIEESPFFIVYIPDFSIEDIKNIVKKYNREKNVCHFFFDYIFSSMKVMMNMGGKLGMGLKEHQFLLLFSNELKTICQQLKVFMYTACQLNGEVVNAAIKDQNVLAGSKALSNKLDFGCNSLPPSASEMKKVEPILRHMIFKHAPNMITWVYKCRSGRITRVMVWSYYDLGTLRCTDYFVTDYNYNLIDVDMTKIEIVEQVIQEHSVNESEVPDEPIDMETEDEELSEVKTATVNKNQDDNGESHGKYNFGF